MNRPTVSVIIPSFNHARFIVNALESVFCQTYRPLQVILIDDGSRDETFEIARDYMASYLPTGIAIKQRNVGAARTINRGISLATGDYVTILNSDDAFHPERIRLCVDFAERRAADFVYTGVCCIDDAGSAVREGDYVRDLAEVDRKSLSYPTRSFAFLRNQLTVSTGNLFLSSDLVRKVGTFRTYAYIHDWDYALRCMFYAEPLKIDSELYYYRIHDQNSYKSLQHIVGYETFEVMRNALWNLTSRHPLNHRAPCPFYWPGLFEQSLEEWDYLGYLSPTQRRIVKQGGLLS